MSDYVKYGVLAATIVAIIVVVLLIVRNTRKSNLNRDIDEINVRFNAVKTIPLAFKLNKAQAMAKRNSETSEKVNAYYERYKEVEKHIEEITLSLEDIDDAYAANEYKQAETIVENVKNSIDDLEKEVSSIDEFLEQFSEKENTQRDISARLKEDYRDIKLKITDNSNYFSIAYDGVEKLLEKCEELFSQSEEWMYANDYSKAEEALNEIDLKIDELNKCMEEIPELIKDAKGVIPYLYDEAVRQNELARQRGVFLGHLNIETRLKEVQDALQATTKLLIDANIQGVREELDREKEVLNNILENLEKENKDFGDARVVYDQINSNIENIKSLYNYVQVSFEADNERFDMEEMGEFLKNTKHHIDDYTSDAIDFGNVIEANDRAASEIKAELDNLFNVTENDRVKLLDYKQLIDKNTNDEDRAKTQLIKLQVVLNEVEVKVNEYHLPSIASTYKDDLQTGREKIVEIKELLEEIPLNIDKLNSTLDEAIDYIYTFYNNVNNIVGMAIMVENAIVFGNKFRSNYPAVDRDLSKAEFSYLNGEYTKALTMAIACMETLFPNKANEKILENS